MNFGGKKVWPDGPSSVVVPKKTVTLTPTNMQEDLTVTITVNDELAATGLGQTVLGGSCGLITGLISNAILDDDSPGGEIS